MRIGFAFVSRCSEAEPCNCLRASNVRVGLKIPRHYGAVLRAILNKKIKTAGEKSLDAWYQKGTGPGGGCQWFKELAKPTPVGVDIRDYLSLDDSIIEVDLTPNRADCLSVEFSGEVAALNKMDWSNRPKSTMSVVIKNALTVSVEATEAARYFGA